jgi:rhodanese-related sulfurtransferase
LKVLINSGEYLIHCAGGYRSMVAASFMKSKGIRNVKNVWGGFEMIKKEEVEIVEAKA